MSIQREVLSENHPEIAKSFNNIGSAHQRCGNLLKALENYEKCYEILEKIPDVNISQAIACFVNLGMTNDILEKYERALYFYKKYIVIV